MTKLVKIRRGTTSEWGTIDPVLAQGEPGYDYSLNIIKIGNGLDTWAELPTDFLTGPRGNPGLSAVEPGTVLYTISANSPSGYIKADGSELLAAEYPSLTMFKNSVYSGIGSDYGTSEQLNATVTVTPTPDVGLVTGLTDGIFYDTNNQNQYVRWNMPSLNGGPIVINISFPYPIAITNYGLFSQGPGSNRPSGWTLEGSNDNITWSLLDTKTGSPNLTSYAEVLYEVGRLNYNAMPNKITISNQTAYKNYRISISQFTFNDPWNSIYLTEIVLGGIPITQDLSKVFLPALDTIVSNNVTFYPHIKI
jgi:hypothetical protein